MASPDELARELLDRARARGQAVVRCDASVPVDAVREQVRSEARAAGVKIRTGTLDDVLVVARADADLWTDDTATMRAKLAAPDDAGRVV